MRAYSTNDGNIWPTRAHAQRWLLGNVAEVPADYVEPEGAITEVCCASYDTSPEIAFVEAWTEERACDSLKHAALAIGALVV
jgi:hypothetical protein